MPIHYALHPNKLTGNPNDYMAIINFTGSIDEEALIEQMMRQGSTITRADTKAVLDNYHTAIIYFVLNGFKVTTKTANYGASIKGIFTGPQDTFSPDRHRLEPQVSAGAELRRETSRNGRVAKLEGGINAPHLLAYLDVNSDSLDSLITPGGLGRLTGYRLKFDPADLEQGIFFTNGSTSTRVEVVGKNKPGELMFLVPTGLEPGSYTL
jgi:hypothetical protein